MKLSRQWLEDYLGLEGIDDSRLEELITTRIAEVEAVLKLGAPLASAILVEVKKVEKHPESKKLSLATIDSGAGEQIIVCGASNVREGLTTAFVPPGGLVADGKGSCFEVGIKKVAGVESPGILVSALELDIASDGEGIIELESSLNPGTLLSSFLGDPDIVFEIDNKSLTHRPDLWGHFGFARELAAITGRPLLKNLDQLSDANPQGQAALADLASEGEPSIKISILAETEVSRFTALGLDGVKPEASPEWLKRRLHNVGAGVRNLLVDLSNYVMFDTGQPNHAYDAEKLSGTSLKVRFASKDEKFLALDDNSYELSQEDVVIADENGVIALGGIIGGAQSAVSDGTSKILLESANFEAIRTRKTGKRHALRTDASNRFEKARTPYAAPLATLRYLELLREIQPKCKVCYGFADSFVSPPKFHSVSIPKGYISSRLGAELSDSKTEELLSGLGFLKTEVDGELSFSVPWFRPARDVSIAADLVEEVGRTFGYENIAELAPKISASASRRPAIKDLEYRLADFLRGSGFSQYESESFVNSELEAELGYPESDAVLLKNPVDLNQAKLRSSLVTGMMKAVSVNSKFHNIVQLFEIGRVFSTREPLQSALSAVKYKNAPVHEFRRLAVLLSSSQKNASDGCLFYQLRGVVQRLLALVTDQELVIEPAPSSAEFPASRSWMHPQRAAIVKLGDRAIAEMAEINPYLIGGERAVLLLLDLELLLDCQEAAQFKELSKFPESFFEVSIVAPEREPFSSLENLLKSSVSAKLMKGLEVLSVYRGEPLEQGLKSVSVRMMFGSKDSTLSSEQLESLQQNVIASIEKSPFSLRS